MIVLANVMIPTVAEHVVIMLLVLFPVALIEAAILAKRHDLVEDIEHVITLERDHSHRPIIWIDTRRNILYTYWTD